MTAPDSPFRDTEAESGAASFGMCIFLGSEAMLFGALFLAYAGARIEHGEGFAAASARLSWQLGSLNTAVLLSSSFAVALAHHFIQATSPRSGPRCLTATTGLGALFLVIKCLEYGMEYREGLMPLEGLEFRFEGSDRGGAELFFHFYFCMTGLHAVHLFSGLLWAGWLLVLSDVSNESRKQSLLNFGLYWHFVDIVWIFLFPLLYLIRP